MIAMTPRSSPGRLAVDAGFQSMMMPTLDRFLLVRSRTTVRFRLGFSFDVLSHHVLRLDDLFSRAAQ